jgi:predicted enzyme related to lactoylglutathione lyase
MNHLRFLIVFTHDIERLKGFYRDIMGFDVRSETPFFVSFATGEAILSLLAVRPAQTRELELCFHSDDLDADLRHLKSRGVTFLNEPRTLEFGRVVHARDPEGNLISLLQPVTPEAPGPGLALSAAVLNCRDLPAARAWYRDRLGLPVLVDSPWWVEFDAGETRVALHPLVDRGVLESDQRTPVAIGLSSGDLDEWVEDLRLRGAEFAQGITDRGFGRFAETRDPDGNILVLRDSPAPPTFEEKLAEDYETGDQPLRVAMRKAVNKNSKAVSRLAIRPDYRADKRAAGRSSASATGRAQPGRAASAAAKAGGNGVATGTARKRARSIRSVRGAGPDRTRLKPRRTKDPERARTKPAVGHQKRATARSLASQKRRDAVASRTRPVKRQANRATARSRAAARASSRGRKGR